MASPVNLQQTVMDPVQHSKKLSLLRKDSIIDDRYPQLSTDKLVEKSIASDDSDEEPAFSSELSVDLKPGLNILVSFNCFNVS